MVLPGRADAEGIAAAGRVNARCARHVLAALGRWPAIEMRRAASRKGETIHRSYHDADDASLADLAEEYSVGRSTIHRIVSGTAPRA